MAGRPKKIDTNKPELTPDTKLTTLENENKDLREKLSNIEKMLLELSAKKVELPAETPKVIDTDDFDEFSDDYEIQIDPLKYIKVMSLTPNLLNLSTEGFGKGKIYTFAKFGQVKDIPYGELADIIHNQEDFTNAGRYYIMNRDVIKKHTLEDTYNKLLNKKTIDSIMDFDTLKIHNIFVNATKAQQETIVRILINKLKNKESIDLNKLEVINKIYGKNIKDMVEQSQQEDDE